MSKEYPVRGLAELDKVLSHFAPNLQKGAYRTALTAAAAPVRDKARQFAPKESGAMARSIKSGSARQNPDGTFSITVGLKGKDSFLGIFHEYGTAAHIISAKQFSEYSPSTRTLNQVLRSGAEIEKGKRKGSLKINGKWVGGLVLHPGTHARPFMRPALDLAADDAVRAFTARIRDYIEGKSGLAVPLDDAA